MINDAEHRESMALLRAICAAMLDLALEDIRIPDDEIRRARKYVRADLIAAKVTAWEWLFAPWKGLTPQLPLEVVCSMIGTSANEVRLRVRREAEPTVYVIPRDERIAELLKEGREDRAYRKRGAASAAVASISAGRPLRATFLADDDLEFSVLVRSALGLLKSA